MSQSLLSAAYRGRFLAVMLTVALFNFADRAVFSVVSPALRHDLGFTDGQIGLLQGFSFALLYGGLGLPVGRLAERYSRVRIIAAATAIWSAATVCCGAAGGFAQMMLARISVGMGEAGFASPTASLVADHFPPRRRASAMSVIMLGLPAGTLLGAIGGGQIAQAYGWRMAFLVLGLPGLAVAALAFYMLREPPRGLADGGLRPSRVVPPLAAVLRHVSSVRAIRHVMIGGALCTLGVQGVAQFMPMLLTRAFHLPLGQAALMFGVVSASSLSVGLLLGALGTDRASLRDERWPAWGPAVALLLAPLCYLAAFTQVTVPAMVTLLLGGGVLAMVYYGPSVGLLQNLTPQPMRASTAAVFGMATALVGNGIGPTLVGFASDRFAAQLFAGGDYAVLCRPGAALDQAVAEACAAASLGGLRRAMMISVLSFGWAAVHYFWASRSLREDLRAARAAALSA